MISNMSKPLGIPFEQTPVVAEVNQPSSTIINHHQPSSTIINHPLAFAQERWSVEKMSELEKPPEMRSYTACYHGADSDALAIYKYANTTATRT